MKKFLLTVAALFALAMPAAASDYGFQRTTIVDVNGRVLVIEEPTNANFLVRGGFFPRRVVDVVQVDRFGRRFVTKTVIRNGRVVRQRFFVR